MQYTGGWEDLALLTILSAIGVVCKHTLTLVDQQSLCAYVVAFKIDEYFWGTLQLYGYKQWKPGLYFYGRTLDGENYLIFTIIPIFLVCIVIAVGIFLNSVLRKDKGIDYV